MTAHNFTKQEMEFCSLYVMTHNGTRSAKDAGFPEASAHTAAHRLLKKDYILDRIAELQDEANKELCEDTNVSTAFIVKRLLRQGDTAEKSGQHAAAINATIWLGKTLAMFTDRVENTQTQTTEEVLEQLDDVGPIGKALVEHIIEGRPADDESIVHLVNGVLAQVAADKRAEELKAQIESAARLRERGNGQKRLEAPGGQATH